jgi:hypothetical protein
MLDLAQQVFIGEPATSTNMGGHSSESCRNELRLYPRGMAPGWSDIGRSTVSDGFDDTVVVVATSEAVGSPLPKERGGNWLRAT